MSMNSPEFFETRMGQKFYVAQLPALITALERIADVLEGMQERWNTNDESAKPSEKGCKGSTPKQV